MKQTTITTLRGMHSHHVGAYFKIYHLCKDRQVSELWADNIAVYLADVFISDNVSMRHAKVQQEALAIDVALTALEKVNLLSYNEDKIVISELYKKPQERNEKLTEVLDGVWNEWIVYKQTNKPYKTARTELIAFNHLMKSCKNDEKLAKDVILNAIARQWMGLNADVCIRQWKDASETFSKLAPLTKLIKEKHDKIGRIDRQDLQEWIESN